MDSKAELNQRIEAVAKASGQLAATLARFSQVMKRIQRSAAQNEPIRLSGVDSRALLECLKIVLEQRPEPEVDSDG
jgi:hypothetical protein